MSISICGVDLWNSLELEFKQSTNRNHFKKMGKQSFWKRKRKRKSVHWEYVEDKWKNLKTSNSRIK